MERDEEQLEELLAAYVLDELAPAERDRVEAMLAADPELDREARELRAALDALEGADLGPDALAAAGPVPVGLADAVVEELGLEDRATPLEDLDRRPDQPRGTSTAAADAAFRQGVGSRPGRLPTWARVAVPAAAVVAVLVFTVAVMQGLRTPEPGLGVHEPVAFEVVQPGVAVRDASLVPHTWGTEVFLTMTGLEDGVVYALDLESADGTVVSAGTFLGDADLEVVCVMNGALLREDVLRIVVTTEDGDEVLRAELDPVDFRSV